METDSIMNRTTKISGALLYNSQYYSERIIKKVACQDKKLMVECEEVICTIRVLSKEYKTQEAATCAVQIRNAQIF